MCCTHLRNTEREDYPVALHDDVLSPQTCFEDIVTAQSIPAIMHHRFTRDLWQQAIPLRVKMVTPATKTYTAGAT